MADNLTGARTHVAIAQGHAPGGVVSPGEVVPPGIPVGSWMKPIRESEDAPKPAGLEAFDHDGDGRPGGSRKGGNRRKK